MSRVQVPLAAVIMKKPSRGDDVFTNSSNNYKLSLVILHRVINMKNSSRGYNRDVSIRKALRKRRISRQIYWDDVDYYDNLHQYSKNKIHCSCPLCSQKTKNKGKRKKGNYNRTLNYKASDYKKIERLENEREEYYEDI